LIAPFQIIIQSKCLRQNNYYAKCERLANARNSWIGEFSAVSLTPMPISLSCKFKLYARRDAYLAGFVVHGAVAGLSFSRVAKGNVKVAWSEASARPKSIMA
jgi:hypothetical protein